MHRYFFCFLAALFCTMVTAGQAPLKFTRLDSTRLPKGIVYKGQLKSAIRWKDKAGDNLVIASETGTYENAAWKHETEGQDAEVFARHYLLKDTLQRSWSVYDYIQDCPLDLEATFIKNTLQATDLDRDGLAEVWVMYKTACRGDVSPSSMKLIMYEGQQKFAMRGENKVQVSKKEYYGGGYKLDAAFAKGPKAFRDFARKLWNRNILQKWE